MNFIVEESTPIDDQKPHKAELVDIKQGSSDSYGDYLKFLFRLVEDPHGTLVSGICPAQLIIGNRLYSWLSVLNGYNLEVGTQIEPEVYVGRIVELLVKNVENGGRTYSNVDSLVKLVNADN